MITIAPIHAKNYMLISVEDPTSELHATSIYAPMDVVFITPEGVIAQIVPKLVLNNLSGTVASPKPLRAFLLLGAGDAAQLDIQPGDRVEHPLFQPGPKVQR